MRLATRCRLMVGVLFLLYAGVVAQKGPGRHRQPGDREISGSGPCLALPQAFP